jgi:hypothetical protein
VSSALPLSTTTMSVMPACRSDAHLRRQRTTAPITGPSLSAGMMMLVVMPDSPVACFMNSGCERKNTLPLAGIYKSARQVKTDIFSINSFD